MQKENEGQERLQLSQTNLTRKICGSHLGGLKPFPYTSFLHSFIPCLVRLLLCQCFGSLHSGRDWRNKGRPLILSSLPFRGWAFRQLFRSQDPKARIHFVRLPCLITKIPYLHLMPTIGLVAAGRIGRRAASLQIVPTNQPPTETSSRLMMRHCL